MDQFLLMFAQIPTAPADAIFSVSQAFQNDPSECKVNLVVGAYRDEGGKPVVFDAVRAAGERIYAKGSARDKEYLSMGGSPAFCAAARELIFGAEAEAVVQKRIATVQSVSGTGALTVVGSLLRKIMPMETKVYVSDPTWPNHIFIYSELLGFQVEKYRYWDAAAVGCNIKNMVADLRAAPMRSVVLLHPCAHNPTGEDPTKEEWDAILEVVKERHHFAVLDSAYQGFATRDLDRDAYAVRLFEKAHVEFAVCQSFAKNMGLYGERAGAAHVVCSSPLEATTVNGRLQRMCRLLWSNPPRHGSDLALEVLTDPELRASWEQQLYNVSDRILQMREALKEGLEKRSTPGDWSHITKQIGMFSYTGLNPSQVKYLTTKYHIYLMASGRISMPGLNSSNVDYVAQAIDDAVRNIY